MFFIEFYLKKYSIHLLEDHMLDSGVDDTNDEFGIKREELKLWLEVGVTILQASCFELLVTKT
jgi:hypothetical protein